MHIYQIVRVLTGCSDSDSEILLTAQARKVEGRDFEYNAWSASITSSSLSTSLLESSNSDSEVTLRSTVMAVNLAPVRRWHLAWIDFLFLQGISVLGHDLSPKKTVYKIGISGKNLKQKGHFFWKCEKLYLLGTFTLNLSAGLHLRSV